MTIKIQTKIGNLLDVTHGHIVQGCNAQGVQGAGIALAIRQKWPGCYEDYRDIHENDGLELGTAYPWCPTTDLVIWNAITQEVCSQGERACSYEAIATAFEDINNAVIGFNEVVKEIHIPMIGAGLARGNWEIIREIIEQTVTVPVTLWVLPT